VHWYSFKVNFVTSGTQTPSVRRAVVVTTRVNRSLKEKSPGGHKNVRGFGHFDYVIFLLLKAQDIHLMNK
jgi:hypothetical protein